MDFVNELNDTKPIADILFKYASKAGRDVITTWNDWLSWCCKVFEWRNFGLIAKSFTFPMMDNYIYISIGLYNGR